MRALHFITLLGLLACQMFAAEPAPPPQPPKPRKLDKPAAEMDYGQFLSCSVGTRDGSNIAFKGIVISLNKEKTANVCFDTELMRVHSAWTGAFLDLAGRNFADNSNDYPLLHPDATVHFGTRVTPGWAKGDARDDPRPPADPNAPKDGALPRDWAKYRGLYAHGEKTILSYTLGNAEVLELFGTESIGNETAFTRTININKNDTNQMLLVCELDKDPSVQGAVYPLNGKDTTFNPQQHEKCGHATNRMAVIHNATRGIFAQVIGAPKDALWHIMGNRVYLRLTAEKKMQFKVIIASLPADNNKAPDEFVQQFTKLNAGGVEDLKPYLKNAPPRWPETVATKGELGKPEKENDPYVIDTLTPPEVNPYKSWLRFGGFDFFKDGKSAALCTWNGDVWVVSGIDDSLQNLTWKRFATGLHQPLGLKIVDDVVYTAGRDQLTRLLDLNKDGEADFYENFNNDCFLTTNFHECCFDLQTDKEGNFYFAKGAAIWAGALRMSAHAGSICKVSKDGAKFETLCSGLRAPNGVGVGPNGEITCADNQGNWVPTCPINFIKRGEYYGWVGQNQEPKERANPMVWIPFYMNKSAGAQSWVPAKNDKWGPLQNQIIETSYDCSFSLILREQVGDTMQGGVVKLPLAFPSGVMRNRFHPKDGQLYVCGLRGWSSKAAKECCFQRVRYTGKPLHLPVVVKTSKAGLSVTFTHTLDPQSANDAENYGAERFWLKRTGAYGSPEFSDPEFKTQGRQTVEVKSANIFPDGRTVVLELADMQPAHCLILKFNLKAADGSAIKYEMSYTINAIP